HAGGPVDGVGQGGGGRVDDDLADGLGPEGAGGLVAVLKLHPQAAHIQPGGQPVLEEGGLAGAAVVVVLDVLGQGVADALDDAPFGLDAGQGRVDGDAAVHHRHVVQHGDLAGLLVQLDLHHAHHVGRGRHRRRMAGRRFGGDVGGYLALGADLLQGDRLPGGGPADLPPLKNDLLRGAAQHPGGNGADLLLQLGVGLLHRFAGDVGGGGSVGARVVGGGVGVRPKDGHVLHFAVHALGGHLGQDGVAAGAHVGGADDQVVGAVLAQLDGGGAHVH